MSELVQKISEQQRRIKKYSLAIETLEGQIENLRDMTQINYPDNQKLYQLLHTYSCFDSRTISEEGKLKIHEAIQKIIKNELCLAEENMETLLSPEGIIDYL